MTGKEMKLATFALMLGLAATTGARAAAVDMNLDAFQAEAPTTQWYKKYGGELNDKQTAKLNNMAADKADTWLSKYQAKIANRQAKWYSKSPFVSGDNGTVTVKGKGKGANFFTASDALVDAEFSANFSAAGKRAKGAVGLVFGYNTPQSTGGDASYFLLDWTADKKKSEGALTLSYIDGLVSGKGKKSELNSKTSSSTATVTVLGSLLGGYQTGVNYALGVSYTSDAIVITVNGETVFSVAVADLTGFDSFEAGAFGLYNANTRGVGFWGLQANLLGGQNANDYGSLSNQEIIDVAGSSTVGALEAPTPSAAAAGLALMGLTVARRRRRHAA